MRYLDAAVQNRNQQPIPADSLATKMPGALQRRSHGGPPIHVHLLEDRGLKMKLFHNSQAAPLRTVHCEECSER